MGNINNILIVEDEENIALALESIISRGINNSNIQIANNGQQAWEMLMEQAYDLILSDWNMPIKSGDDLLLDVRQDERTRHIPFLMLTARADRDSLITAIQGGVNDYIAKPFEKSDVIDKVRKHLAKADDSDTPSARSVEDIVEEIVQRLKNDIIKFPVMPDVGIKVKELLQNDDTTIEELASVIKSDPTLTSKLISLSNSSLYRGTKLTQTLEEAIARIGLRQTESYVFTLSQRGLFHSNNTLCAEHMNRLWDHSLATGAAARATAAHLGLANPENYFTMGVLHDIGILLLLQLLQTIHNGGHLLEKETIEEILTRLHCQFGASLLKNWGFSEEFVDIAQHHHCVAYLNDNTETVVLIAFADRMAHDMGYGMLQVEDEELLNHPATHHLGLKTEAIIEITNAARCHVDELSSTVGR